MSKRKPLHSSGNSNFKNSSFGPLPSNVNLNYRPSSIYEDRGGTKPIAPPSSVSLVIGTMIVHICKKFILFDPQLKAAMYLVAIVVGSVLADILPVPKTYFSRSNNILNQYFIKWAWGWLLAIVGPWILLTAHVIGCGKKGVVIKHLTRLVFATLAWMFWMNIFHYVENNYGRCLKTNNRAHQIKSKCLQAGKFWNGLDISGHAFIIIYSCLILTEEAYSMVGWEKIKNLIVAEEHGKKSQNKGSTCLSKLSSTDFDFLKKAYEALTPFLRGIFVAMTIQQLLWQVMLVATIMYYHLLIEKFLGAAAAILTWYVTYYWFFRMSQLGMAMPGDGIFKYNDLKERSWQENGFKLYKRSASNVGPTFMGMPIKTPTN